LSFAFSTEFCESKQQSSGHDQSARMVSDSKGKEIKM